MKQIIVVFMMIMCALPVFSGDEPLGGMLWAADDFMSGITADPGDENIDYYLEQSSESGETTNIIKLVIKNELIKKSMGDWSGYRCEVYGDYMGDIFYVSAFISTPDMYQGGDYFGRKEMLSGAFEFVFVGEYGEREVKGYMVLSEDLSMELNDPESDDTSTGLWYPSSGDRETGELQIQEGPVSKTYSYTVITPAVIALQLLWINTEEEPFQEPDIKGMFFLVATK